MLVASLPVLIWLILLFARGGFWRVSRNLAPARLPAPQPQTVLAVIPARDEAEGIAATIASLLEQDFPALQHIFVVDDNSSDGTGEIARRTASELHKSHLLTVISGKPLPPGWTGKLWALSQGVEAAQQIAPDFLLFTDADITHCPGSVSELLSIAQAGPYDLTSFMVKLACRTTAEAALIPAFVFFFFMLYPPAWISSGRHKTAGAAGGCVLIRSTMLSQIGGIHAIRNQVIDDCALARKVKDHGGRVWLGLTDSRHSQRWYATFGEIGRMVSRTAFNQLDHSVLLLLGTVVGLLVTYILPIALLFTNRTVPVLLGTAAWLLMTGAYLPTVRFYRCSVLWAFALPLIATFYLGATVYSAIRYWTGKGGEWKGRAQDTQQKPTR